MIGNDPSVLQLLVALAAVLAAGQLLGRGFAAAGQPSVIGEVVAGIALGPSVLGRLAPELADVILPPSVGPLLNQVAQLGAVLYMFLIGVELDVGTMSRDARATVAIAHAGIVTPFVLAGAVAWAMYPYGAGVGVPFISYALFLGVTLAITAFPVLARILADGGLRHSPLGRQALACAAVADVSAWCLLAFVIGATQASVADAIVTLLLTLAFSALMVAVVGPLASRAGRRTNSSIGRPTLALTLLALLVSAAITEALGVHAIFGAFLLGALIPADSALARALRARLEDVVTILLLPAFFAVTGLRTVVSTLAGPADWLVLATVVAAGSIGKVGGTAIAARVAGGEWRHALGLGALMNTRGLMQLIVLNIGLDLGIFSPSLFSILAVAALISTVATAPALHLLGLWMPLPSAMPPSVPSSPPAAGLCDGTERHSIATSTEPSVRAGDTRPGISSSET